MNFYLIAIACVLICFVALYIAYKVFKDSKSLRKQAKEEEENSNFTTL